MVFLDSNIWMYGFIETQSPRKYRIAKQLIEREAFAISTQVVGEVCNALLRRAHASEDRIQKIIGDMEAQYHPLVITLSHLKRASQLRMRYNFSHWDSLIVVAALESNCSILYSEDMQDGLVVDGTLTIRNPFAEP